MYQLSNQARDSIKKRFNDCLVEQKKTYQKILEGRPLDAEDQEDRKIAFIKRQVSVPDNIARLIGEYKNPELLPINDEAKKKAEVIQGPTIDFMGIYFLDLARSASKAVGRVIFKDGRPQGTGFMISPDLFITNNHVISKEDEGEIFNVQFNYEQDYRKINLSTSIFELDPSKFFFSVNEDDLDFTIIAVGKRVSGNEKIEAFGFIPLFEADDKHIKGVFVNCIQHPEGNPKQVVVRENKILARTSNTIIYSSDTMPGSSGSPVFNDDWEVVALHHWGEPYKSLVDQPEGLPKNGNEGIRISSIVKRLKSLDPDLNKLSTDEKKLLNTSLGFQFRQPSLIISTFLNEKENVQTSDEMEVAEPLKFLPPKNNNIADDQKTVITPALNAQGMSFTVPLTISVQLGTSPMQISTEKEEPPFAITDNTAEAAKNNAIFEPDPNYSNRKGYDPGFLGVKVSLPKLSAGQKSIAAINKRVKQGDDKHEFKYQNFSIIMNGERRIAYFTAVNIDGSSVISINRETGVIKHGPESVGAESGREKWYDDPRIDSDNVCEDKLYKDDPDMKDFQRGHLVKRTDPSWGTVARAFKGQADTFHFLNCSPQHEEFNPIKTRWAGIEDWITNTSDDENIRVSVFSGPVFEENDPAAGYIKVPKAFWKIVAWVEDEKLKAIAILADQSKLLKKSGFKVSEAISKKESLDELPDKLPAEYHTSVEHLEEITGLNFGNLSEHDVFDKSEAISADMRRITDFTDIKL